MSFPQADDDDDDSVIPISRQPLPNLRKRATTKIHEKFKAAGIRRGGYGAEGEEDDSLKLFFRGICYFIFLAIVVTILALVIVLTWRTVAPKALSTSCDDSNPCTHDFLETVRGVDEGCCTHCNVPNEASCENICYDSPQCMDGSCVGTCKGHCQDSNALDCPIISAANLTSLFGLGGVGNTDAGDYFTLYRECAISTCIYTIHVVISNVTYARDGFVVSRQRFFRGNDTNISAVNGTHQYASYIGWADFQSNLICLPLISSEFQDCMRVINMDVDLTDVSGAFDATCTYAFACAKPPSADGSIDFPVRMK